MKKPEMEQRKPETEQRLNMEGASWHYEYDVPLSKIDRVASRQNQARFQPIDNDRVDDMVLFLASGGVFPALVGYYNRQGDIVLIDGNHRDETYIRAAQLNFKTVTTSDFYIVDGAPDWLIDRLTRTINIGQGGDISKEERISQAMHFRATQNIPVEELSRMVQLPRTTLVEAIHAGEVKNRLSRLGFTDPLSPKTLGMLHRIVQDKALVEIARLVKEALLNSDEAREVVSRVVRAAVSEKQQENELVRLREEYRTRMARVRRGRIPSQAIPSIKLRRAFNAINATRPGTVVPVEPDVLRRLRYAKKKMDEIERLTLEARGEA